MFLSMYVQDRPGADRTKRRIRRRFFVCVAQKRLVEAGHPSRHPGGRLNKKDGLTRYGDSHVKDKTS